MLLGLGALTATGGAVVIAASGSSDTLSSGVQ
jgi:hypothetical protein